MSRILGRANDVLNVSVNLQSDFPKYKKDKSQSSWNSIEIIKDSLNEFLPDIAVNYINKDKIEVIKNPLRIYTFTNVPEFNDEVRYIRFPSRKPIKEFEREYAFYLGLLLSSYQIDTEEELLEVGKEYDDILPLLLDYLYLKKYNIEDRFSLKYLNFLKKYTKSFPKSYNSYKEFCDFYSNANTYILDDERFNNFNKLCDEQDENMESIVLSNIIKLSSMDGVLQIIDKNYSNNEIQQLIKELMLNKDENRSSILYERGIESFGYKRLIKEIDKYKMK